VSTSPAIATEQLSVSIADTPICQQLNLAINKGECWAILGQNGCGKTTLLHTLAGLHKPDNGQVLLDNTPLSRISTRAAARQCGLLLQDYQDIFPASIMQAVLIGRHPHLTAWQWESKEDIRIALSALRDVELADMSQRDIQTLSGGERRRVAIATLLAQQPAVFLLDEPVNHLDIRHQHQVLEMFSTKAKKENKAVIMVLHDVNLAVRYCDHALLMYGENKIELGATKEVLNEENLSALYDYPIKQTGNGTLAFMPN
jgi:iron complex transport system ATP-binding protein